MGCLLGLLLFIPAWLIAAAALDYLTPLPEGADSVVGIFIAGIVALIPSAVQRSRERRVQVRMEHDRVRRGYRRCPRCHGTGRENIGGSQRPFLINCSCGGGWVRGW